MTDVGGDNSTLQGDFGESWLEVAASAIKMDHGRVGTTDLDRADVELTLRGEHWGLQSPTVKAQVKSSTKLREIDDATVAYDLDVGTYHFLCRKNHATPRVLVVVHLREDGVWAAVDEKEMRLYGRGYWVSLEAGPDTSNRATIAVHLPRRNALDEEGLMRMMRVCAARRSSVVPDCDPWRGQ